MTDQRLRGKIKQLESEALFRLNKDINNARKPLESVSELERARMRTVLNYLDIPKSAGKQGIKYISENNIIYS